MSSRRALCASAFFPLAGFPVVALAAFFQIAENSPAGIGNAFAGGAAIAEDASTVWYNPAGMTRLRDAQVVLGGHYIHPSFKASVNGASTALNFPISGGGGEAGEAALVPNLYAVVPVFTRFRVGLGVNAPFGLATDYDDTWAGRYHALRSDIRTVNVNLAAAFRVARFLSLGVGANYQKLEAELTQAVDFATLCTAAAILPPPAIPGTSACGAPTFTHPNSPNDGKAKVTATGDARGYNAGLLAQLGPARLGLAYRSQMKYDLKGDFDVTAPANVPSALLTDSRFRLVDSGASADVTLPATISASAVGDLGERWTVMADVTRTHWSSLPELRIMFDSGQADSVVTLNLKDVYRYSVGASYKANGAWVLRAGAALDRSPVAAAADRTPRLPDSDRTWLALGAGWRASPGFSVDLGYAYVKLEDNSVAKTAGGAGSENFSRGNLSADYRGAVRIYSAQAKWLF